MNKIHQCRLFLASSVILILTLSTLGLKAQNAEAEITLQSCYEWSEQNYPLIRQYELIDKASEFTLKNAANGNLPQISLNGQATYQSDVTAFPIDLPNLEVPSIDKDQYKVFMEIYQPLSNFSRINASKEIILNDADLEKQKIAVEVYKLRDRVNQVFFGILLNHERKQQLELAISDLDSLAVKLQVAIERGVAVETDIKLLQIEKLNVQQKIQENESNREAFCQILSALTGRSITINTKIMAPSRFFVMPSISRLELEVYELQRMSLVLKEKQLDRNLLPNIGFFVQGGYGRPALNFLSNDFEFYYLGGLKFNWNISSLYNYKNAKKHLLLSNERISNREATFLFNTNLNITQESIEMKKYDQLIESDLEIIALREEVLSNAEVQLSNGLITTIDYLKFLNDVNRARQMLLLHETQYLLAQSNLATTQGL